MVTVELMVIDLKAGLDNTSTAYKRLCKGAEKAGIVHQYSGVPLDTSPKQIFWVLRKLSSLRNRDKISDVSVLQCLIKDLIRRTWYGPRQSTAISHWKS